MNQALKQKLNVLIQLANADGHFDVTEKAFIKDLLTEQGIDHRALEAFELGNLKDIHTLVEKEQVLYWAIQLMKADGAIHADEIAFCKAVAFRLKFLPEVIDAFAVKELPEFSVFKKEVDPFRTFSVRD